ncbi:hypothetical protein ACU6TU_00270 [Halomonas sp. LS-001]
MNAFLKINEGRMTTYADLQAVYKQHREAQNAYYIQLEEVVQRIIKDYAEHLGVRGKMAPMNGSMTPYVTQGRLSGLSFEEDNSFQARTMFGKEMATHIGVVVEESERSTRKARVVVELRIWKDQGEYHYLLTAPHSPDKPGIEGRVLNDADYKELYEDISEILLRVMDPEPFK